MVRERAKSANFYYLAGDSFLRKKELEKITGGLSGGTFDLQVFHSHDIDPLKFIEEAASFPFFSAHKVLVVKDAEKLSQKTRETILSAFPAMAPVNVIVFEAEEIHETDVLCQWIGKNGTVLKCSGSPGDFAVLFLRERKKTISREALELLLERTAGKFALLSEALEKLALCSTEGPISPEQVLSLSNEGGTYNAFDLVNAFSKGDKKRSLAILAYLLEDAEAEPEGIVGALNWHLKKRWQANARQGAGFRPAETGGRRLKDAVEELFQLDRGIKTGKVEARKGIESFLVRFG